MPFSIWCFIYLFICLFGDRTGKENVGSSGIYGCVCVSACGLFLEQIDWDIQKICSSSKIKMQRDYKVMQRKQRDYKVMQNRIKNKRVRMWIKTKLMRKNK